MCDVVSSLCDNLKTVFSNILRRKSVAWARVSGVLFNDCLTCFSPYARELFVKNTSRKISRSIIEGHYQKQRLSGRPDSGAGNGSVFARTIGDRSF